MPNIQRPVRIVTDSAADIPKSLADKLDITVVPLLVHIGGPSGKTFRDGVDMSGEQFYRELESTRSVTTTSLPTLESIADAYRKITAEGCDVVSVHMSSKLSGTYDAALMASTEDGVDAEAVSVVDSRTVTMAQGWIAVRCAEAAREGKSRTEIEALAESLVPRAHILGVLGSLEYVMRSGRVGRLPGTVGTLLNVKPILTTRPNGEAVILERLRTRKKALARVLELTQEAGELDRIAVMHGADPAGAEELLAMVQSLNPPQPVIVGHIGAVLGTHIGPEAVGVCFLTR